MSLSNLRRKNRTIRPTNHAKLYNVPFYLKKVYEQEISNMIDAVILIPCNTPTDWIPKPLLSSRVRVWTVDMRLVGDFIGLNAVIQKLLWQT